MENTENKWLREAAPAIKCPKCNAGNLDTRVPRGFIVKHILRLNVKRFKCFSCGAKVYVKA